MHTCPPSPFHDHPSHLGIYAITIPGGYYIPVHSVHAAFPSNKTKSVDTLWLQIQKNLWRDSLSASSLSEASLQLFPANDLKSGGCFLFFWTGWERQKKKHDQKQACTKFRSVV